MPSDICPDNDSFSPLKAVYKCQAIFGGVEVGFLYGGFIVHNDRENRNDSCLSAVKVTRPLN